MPLPIPHCPPPTGARRLCLTLAYDGTEFAGAQVQPGRRTVGSELEGALARLTAAPTRVTFAGRTDRGVHAAGQVAHCDVTTGMGDERLWRALNAVLPPDLAVLRLTTMPGAFHARYDARSREYRYRLWRGETRLPGLARTSWHLAGALDVGAMGEAAQRLLGEHDFAAFAGQGLGVPGRAARRATVRRLDRAECWAEALALPFAPGELVTVRVRASGFLPRMVRTIVAALVEVGRGRRDPDWLAALLRGRARALAPAPAPPQGLTLWRVEYDWGKLVCDRPVPSTGQVYSGKPIAGG